MVTDQKRVTLHGQLVSSGYHADFHGHSTVGAWQVSISVARHGKCESAVSFRTGCSSVGTTDSRDVGK